ncbi:hypothetical protein CWATWH0402_4177 [Crocosphaera watsonii WH 0402]|nr:hypothetical protein CWATWH0402_4177 [Crocosphaera watsonii WH 0402]
MNWSQEQWPKLWDYFSQQNNQGVDDEKRRKQFEERYELVNRLFPLPPSDDQNNKQSPPQKDANETVSSPQTSPSSSSNFSVDDLDC